MHRRPKTFAQHRPHSCLQAYHCTPCQMREIERKRDYLLVTSSAQVMSLLTTQRGPRQPIRAGCTGEASVHNPSTLRINIASILPRKNRIISNTATPQPTTFNYTSPHLSGERMTPHFNWLTSSSHKPGKCARSKWKGWKKHFSSVRNKSGSVVTAYKIKKKNIHAT